jgi:hypothetical protein
VEVNHMSVDFSLDSDIFAIRAKTIAELYRSVAHDDHMLICVSVE